MVFHLYQNQSSNPQTTNPDRQVRVAWLAGYPLVWLVGLRTVPMRVLKVLDLHQPHAPHRQRQLRAFSVKHGVELADHLGAIFHQGFLVCSRARFEASFR